MSLWQFFAAVEGYVQANTPQDKSNKSLSDHEIDEIGDWVDKK